MRDLKLVFGLLWFCLNTGYAILDNSAKIVVHDGHLIISPKQGKNITFQVGPLQNYMYRNHICCASTMFLYCNPILLKVNNLKHQACFFSINTGIAYIIISKHVISTFLFLFNWTRSATS